MGAMDTRASRYAAWLVETGWLAAVVAVPVFFNVWSNRVFEPDKLSLLRTIALVMAVGLGAWFVERGRRSGSGWREWIATPLVAPVLALTAVYVLASAASVVPGLSIFGSYQRLQGLYTWLAYVTVFAAIVTLLRRREQLERLLLAVIIPSLPVALYGVVQSRGLDPMPWLGDVVRRVASTMGNSIFVAAYVIIVVPLTVVKVVESLRAIEPDGGGTARGGSAVSAAATAPVLRAAAYMVLLFVQLVCIVLAQSRGPWLGLAAGLFVMALCAAALRPGTAAMRRRLAALAFLGIGIAPAAALLAFNLAPEGTSLAALRDVRYIGRLGQVLETEGGTGKVRVLIWQGAIDLITADPVRAIVGYGPESMHVAYNPYYPPDLAHYESRNASPDRSHNETLDSLVTTGVLGFAAYMALFTALFAYALRWLGLIDTKRQRNLFLGFWLLGGLAVVVAFRMWSGGWTFFGVALPAGMIGGLVCYVFARALSGQEVPDRPARPLVLALTAALAAHFVEIHFGIAIAATRLLFFVLAGTLVAVGGLGAARPALLANDDPEPERPMPSGARSRRSRRARLPERSPRVSAARSLWSGGAFVMLLLLATMSFDFLVRGLVGEGTADSQELMVLAWLFSLTWAVGSLILGSEALMASQGSSAGMGPYILATLGGFGLYAILHQLMLGGVGGQAGGASTSSALLALFYVGLLALMLGWSMLQSRSDPASEPVSRLSALWAYPVVGLGLLVLAFFTNFNEVRADIYYKEAWQGYHVPANNYLAQGDSTRAEAYFDSALRSYDKAIALDDSEDYYLLFKGKALLERADGEAQSLADAMADEPQSETFSEYDVPDLAALVERRDRAFDKAIDVLEDALDMAPLNTDHYANLGRAYQVWGERTRAPKERAERLQQSLDWFDRAIELSPNNAGLRTEQATSAFLAGDDGAALDRIEQALALDDQYGRPYRLRATLRREAQDWEAAEADYRKYVESRDGRSDAVGWSGLAYVLGKQGKNPEAIEANEKVLELAGDDLPTLRNLVLLYRDTGDARSACAYVDQGLLVSPDDVALLQLAAELACPSSDSGAAAGSGPSPAEPGNGQEPAPDTSQGDAAGDRDTGESSSDRR